ncbi:Bacterial Ig-like domain (group 2) [Pelotomaculum schinkii]|uniref:Bacterial Ig-like domain (Group 2) n=1 Tax=Pelotomaculum schinkii TaxID=78350 RepID=A0A4Y7RI58_9FIRM|nr:Ig-like domain-containing protein [Pelotomaculum schinkii]TEB08007.1 Bacterial Ig-like domain (group 2) [Pelotomaculum schinkii]
MKLRGLEFRPRPWKTVAGVMLLAALLSPLWIAGPAVASTGCGTGVTGVAADTLTIKVGYFGGPYYTKKVYTLSDLDALPQVRQAYTFIDSLPAVCVDAATGVKLTDLLEDARIDVNSVQKFYFFSTDVKKGWYQCLDKSFLLDIPRFYYPNLPSGWDYETASSTPEAVYGAVRVEPIIAYKDNWQRFDAAPDFSAYDTSTRFRLLFGQSDPGEHTAPQSVKWVHAIEVMLGGMPPAGVTLDRNMVELKVGSTVRLTANVAPDEATDKSVHWSSSDTRVATVDNKGLVTVVGPGTAVITVSTVVGNMTATCVVNGPDQDAGAQGVAPTDAGSHRDGAQRTPAGPPAPAQRYLAEKDKSVAGSTTTSVSSGQAGYQPWRVFEMSADAVPLQQQKEQNRMDIFAAALFGSLFLFGLGRRYMEYTREVAM